MISPKSTFRLYEGQENNSDNDDNDDSNNNTDNNNHIERHNSRFLQSPYCAAKLSLAHMLKWQDAVVCKACATHRAFITCNKCAIWYKETGK